MGPLRRIRWKGIRALRFILGDAHHQADKIRSEPLLCCDDPYIVNSSASYAGSPGPRRKPRGPLPLPPPPVRLGLVDLIAAHSRTLAFAKCPSC